MASQVGICNMSLSHLGISKEIAIFETEKSEEAATVRRFYDVALSKILSDYPWPFATRIAALALVAVEPNTEWLYSYRYPVDCLTLRRVISGVRNDTRQSRAPYKIASDASGRLIFTDEEDAQVEYTALITDTLQFQADFALAFSYLMAFLIAPRLTAGDQFKLGDKAFKLYQYTAGQATSNAGNEGQRDEEPDSEFVRARE